MYKAVAIYVLICLGLFGLPNTTIAQQTEQTKVDTLPISFKTSLSKACLLFATDEFGNLYIVTQENDVLKYNAKLDSVGRFNNNRLGKIATIDVSNPFTPILFFQESGFIVQLDRFLDVLNVIKLSDYGLTNITQICRSNDNMIWIFDEWNFKLKKIDFQKNILQESSDLRIALSSIQKIQKIIDANGQLYVYDALYGWYVFDYYFGFSTSVKMPNLKNCWLYDEVFWGYTEKEVWAYYPSQLISKKYMLPLPLLQSKQISITNNLCYSLTQAGISIYNLKL